MPSDESEVAQPSATPWWRRALSRRLPAAWAAALVAAAFGGGVLTAAALDGVLPQRADGAVASESAAEGWRLFGRPRAKDAPRGGPAKPEGFAIWRTRVDSTGPEPRACIEMSRALDPAKAYSDFVLVSPEAPSKPAVTVKGSELCVAGIGFTDRTITLLMGLPARNGEVLAQNAEAPFTFGEKPPYVGFAGEGVILPREEADGIGIETVNVQRLSIEVWRVVDRNLVRKSISAPEPTGEGDWPGDWGDDSPRGEGRLVWKGEVAVNGATGERVTTVFPLGAVLREMKPGGYVIKAKDASGGRGLATGEDDEDDYDPNPPAQARRWVMFTDMALSAYDGSEALDVVVRSLKTARTLPGLRVTLVARNGEELGEGKTDGQGRVRFERPLLEGAEAAKAKMVMAYGPQGDLAVLDLDRPPADLSRQGIGGRTDAVAGRTAAGLVDGYLYADRGVYRPGETVHVSALLRDREARAVKDRRGHIVVRRPSGVELIRYAFTDTPMGYAGADVVLPRTAPRGVWKVALEIAGMDEPAGEMTFNVEDFAPQRLEVTASGREDVPLAPGESRPIEVLARFLYGAVGSGLTTQGEARLRADPNPFPQHEGYQWGDQRDPFKERLLELPETVTDGQGRAVIQLVADEGADTAQPLEAEFVASVFEPGGRPVREGLKLKVRSRPLYLGVKVDIGEASGRGDPLVNLDVIAVDAAGTRIAAPGTTYRLISETWNYDWFQQDGRWQWRRTSRDVVAASGPLDVTAQKPARIARRLGWGDYRLELTGPDGAASVIRFASGWGAPARDVETPDMVRVTAGPGSYEQGDTVEITFKPPYAGEAQIAVATDRLIDFQTVSVGEEGRTVKLTTSAAWGGGAYVLVTVIQPRDPVATPKPRRALGLVYVPLDPKKRKLDVDIGTPAKIHAKQQLEVPLTIKGVGLRGKARLTVAAVDEGILRITRFESPDPAKWYFGKQALSLDYRDDYGRLLDPNLGAPANVNFGADGIGGEGLTATPIRTVALYSGMVETDAGGKVTVRMPAPDYNGELRLMVVAWTDEAVGAAAKPLVSREPVVADLSLPRFMAPGDTAYATLELHNLEGKPGDYVAEVSSQGGLAAKFRKLFRLVLGQREAERIPFEAPRAAGVGKVGFKVAGPGFQTARDYPLQTRLGWGPVTRTTTALQKPGEAFTPPASLLAGLAAGDVTLTVSYSPFRGFDPAPIAEALSRYPYGCTEQIVSAAYPLLYAAQASPDAKARRTTPALNQAVGRVLDRQAMDGAFGLWRVGDAEADAWLGAYTTDFLIEAQRLGAPAPKAAMDRSLAAMRQISRPEGWAAVSYRLEYPEWWAGSREASREATSALRRRASAYALYVLAKGGQGDLARLRWWHDVQMKAEPSPLAKAQVAAGLALMGDRARARSAFHEAVRSLGYREESDWYQSPLRDLAAVIGLAYEAGEVDIARSLQGRLENAVKDPDQLNTQEQAFLLKAAHHMLAAAGQIRIQATGATPLPAAGGGPRWAVGRLADARFVNAGSGALWRTVTVRGTPLAAPMAGGTGLVVAKQLLTLSGDPADVGSLRQGDRVIVLIKGRSAQSRTTALVVDDPLPAGFEIEAVLGPDDAQNGPFRFLGELSAADVQEARDDRYVAAMDLGGGKPFALAYLARAVTPGDFLLPGVEARDMYRPTLAARTAARRTTIAPGR
ncbi:MAG: alpha-2-macroglobulin [Phenylobacterium sp.]|jgi:uncharacterized protein YfaS (alpha-2-macroglobulin family)|uniref:alpha-2-macroglobulin family protein n=1 Tax=Phenylobacterium sp. TaxID=1871053 RepID=UPI002A36E146|nr:alpha-2-macroglobulin [Phenylobacterium sp.]MDX9997808.1 alpha-2-macroglobulin [Phenylobacterium sp.]